MSNYKFFYFNVTGLGEPIRYILHYGGIKFDDIRTEYEEWPKTRLQTPLNQLPVLEIDGKQYHQSKAIFRFLAKKFKLYGSNDVEAMEIDAAVDSAEDLREPITMFYYEDDPQYQVKLKDYALTKTKFLLGKFEEQVKANGGYFVGGQLSCAEILYSAYTDFLSNLLGYNLNKDHPELNKLVEKVHAIPNIRDYLNKRPKTRL